MLLWELRHHSGFTQESGLPARTKWQFVVGSMIMTLAMFNLVGLLYSFYGHRECTADAGLAH
ncbi:MAG: hypothetical protein AB7U73_08895 [Pirellulales bacterium]